MRVAPSDGVSGRSHFFPPFPRRYTPTVDGIDIHAAMSECLADLARPSGGELPVASLVFAYLMGLREICIKAGKDPRVVAAAFLEGTSDITPPKETLT